jgi:hypothetical protein
MNADQAERFAADACRQLGFEGARVTPPGADGGIDVIDRQRNLYGQVKAWNKPVGRPDLQKLVGATPANSVRVFFSTSGYTQPAREYADTNKVALFLISSGRWLTDNAHAHRMFENSPPKSGLPVTASQSPDPGCLIASGLWAGVWTLGFLGVGLSDADLDGFGLFLLGLFVFGPLYFAYKEYSSRKAAHETWSARRSQK